MTEFINAFLSYLFVFLIFGGAIVIAVMLGISVRKIKDAKETEKDTEDFES